FIPINNFSKLGLSASIVEVLDRIGFEAPTPVQAKAIPLLLTKDPTDFIGLAQTGTGKTAAFGLPLIDLIDPNLPETQALIMAPTRELGQQTAQQLVSFAQDNPQLNIEVVYGGASISAQMKALKRPTQIVVATPGRLLDLIRRKAIWLDQVRYVVLDEADEMLNMGFKEDIDEILSFTPADRVTWLFSATMPAEIRRITSKYMNAPLEVSVDSKVKSNVDIAHKYVMTKTANKLPALRRFLDLQPNLRGIMFCRTRRETQEISDQLTNQGYGVEALHGDLSQAQRDAVMKRFKARSMQLLIATDVAARGIDVNDLTHVLHHTLPDQLESYTHRSGRTGRAGKKGTSLAFINPREGRRISELEKKLKVKFERVEVPSVDELRSTRIGNWANLIVNTQVDQQAEEMLGQLGDVFEHLSKEDILKRLITSQLDHLTVVNGEEANLNETHGGAPGSRDLGKFNRYFVNIGLMDGLTKGDLIHFLSDISDVDRKYFGDLTMQKSRSYFDVDKTKDQGMSQKFDGIEVEGRSIRVNLDDNPRAKRPEGFDQSKSFKGARRTKKKSGKDRSRGNRRRRT
ncbi:MAG: DEAD/DEAH box helicase, partial [Bacteroidota bacterium]